MHARGFTAKKLWKIRTGPLGRRGPWAAGRWAFGPLGRRGPWAVGRWAAGLLLAKPVTSIISPRGGVNSLSTLGLPSLHGDLIYASLGGPELRWTSYDPNGLGPPF